MSFPVDHRALRTAAVAATLLIASVAHADLLNGNFATNGGAGQVNANTTLASWTVGGKEGNFGSTTQAPVFLYTSAAQLSTGVAGDSFMGTVGFYGGNNLVLPAPSGAIIAADGDASWAGSLSQSVTGLVVGQAYTLSFNWAGAQQLGFSGPTTESWQVSFGTTTQSTATSATPSTSFGAWQQANMSFTATAATQTLKFLAKGTPAGSPPWLLLNNVQMTAAVPEPETYALMFAGLGVVGFIARRRRKA